MVMGVIHSLFRAFSAHENNPARIMQSINEVSCQGNDTTIFVTLYIGVLDLPTGHLRYCDAGHDAPIFIENGKLRKEECIPHLPVGVFDAVKYGTQETQLEPGSTIFLYTDGLTEAKNIARKLFGIKRIEEVLIANSHLQPQQLLEAVSDKVHEFVGDAEQSDDLTLLAIHFTPKHFESTLTETPNMNQAE
jgi:sigma-B regulation protein RsbU (phosphoserine phosphatase)